MAGEMFGAVLKYEGPTPKIATRKKNEIYKEGFVAALTIWHAKFSDKHFTNAGATEYRYTPRSGERGSKRKFKGSYSARKLKKFGHTRPLEFSGESRRRVRASQKIKATSKGGRCILSAPALNFRNPKSPINMREEVTRVSPRERTELAAEFGDYIRGRFQRISDKETVNI